MTTQATTIQMTDAWEASWVASKIRDADSGDATYDAACRTAKSNGKNVTVLGLSRSDLGALIKACIE